MQSLDAAAQAFVSTFESLEIQYAMFELDDAYIRRWAEQLGVSAAVESLLGDRQ